MVRKTVSVTLSVMILLAALAMPALADSWLCPKCGQENAGNFCGNCGTPRPEEPAPGEVTPPPEMPFSGLFFTTPPPEPTDVPGGSGWVDDFGVIMDAGVLSVDFSAYAADHPGQYYVLWEYLNNGFYSWFTMREGFTTKTFRVIPEKPVYVGVYCDTDGKGAPDLDYNRMKPLVMPDEGFYMGHSFRANGHELIIDDGDAAQTVPEFTLAEMKDQADKLAVAFDWSFSVSGDTRIDTLGALTVPGGMTVDYESYFTWRAGTGGKYQYWLKDLLNMAANYDGLTEGEYRFDLYIDGCKAESFTFSAVAERKPVVTAPPVVAVPPVAGAEWVQDFSIFTEPGVIEVDFSSYAATHRGQYYIFYEYDGNGYTSWYELDTGKTSQRITVVPGERIRVGVYCDPQAGGPPAADRAYMKLLTLRTFGNYTGGGFRNNLAEPVLSSGGAIQPVAVYSLSDVLNRPSDVMIHFDWNTSVSADTEVNTLGVLRVPSGAFYFQTLGYTLKNGGMTVVHPLSSLLAVAAHRGTLTEGDYVFELYIEGQRAAAVSFRVGSQRVLASTPTPVPTKKPTPTPTKKPTPTPTKKPTPTPTKKPTEKPRTFRIQAPSMSAGSTTISWEDSANNGPYTVTVQHQYTSGGQTKLAAAQQFAYTSSKSASNGYVMAPGEPYTITVKDRSGKSVTYDYRPKLQIYPDFKISVDIDLKTETPNGTKNQKALSASEIKNHLSNYTFGAYIRLGYSQIRYARTTQWTIAFHIPNGDVFVNQYGADTIPAGQHYSYYKHYGFNHVFDYLIDAYGYIPTGEYYWTLYFDGQRSGQGKFHVNQ